MNYVYYNEMVESFQNHVDKILNKTVFLFGHCEATIVLADFLLEKGITPKAILDNSEQKQGKEYKGIPVVPPLVVLQEPGEKAVVLLVTRFYEAMHTQLNRIGFQGAVIKLIDYNTYAEYSLTRETREWKYQRLLYGKHTLDTLRERYGNRFLVFCPFDALGDVYFCMSYLGEYLHRRNIKEYVVCVPSKGCAAVARLFGAEHVEVYMQKDLDALIQAAIYTQDVNCYIAHQDRPYVVNLHKLLKIKKIPLEKIYCCGIFGLPADTKPAQPSVWKTYRNIKEIREGKAVILSPYAKSVTALPRQIWEGIISVYTKRGYQIFTNVHGDEKPLPGSIPLRANLAEMKSVVERAGTFIGIRSGLCDVIRTADCRKIALYPDYNYCDTKWKAIDMYSLKKFENIVVQGEIS